MGNEWETGLPTAHARMRGFPCGFPGYLWLFMLIKGEHTLTYSSHLRAVYYKYEVEAERDCLATLSISPNLFVMLYYGKTK